MADSVVACPRCGIKLQLKGDVAGKAARCPKCATAFRVGGTPKPATPQHKIPPAVPPTTGPAADVGMKARPRPTGVVSFNVPGALRKTSNLPTVSVPPRNVAPKKLTVSSVVPAPASGRAGEKLPEDDV